jgi:hypothetical protein
MSRTNTTVPSAISSNLDCFYDLYISVVGVGTLLKETILSIYVCIVPFIIFKN